MVFFISQLGDVEVFTVPFQIQFICLSYCIKFTNYSLSIHVTHIRFVIFNYPVIQLH